ncbi:hypothetical protein DFH06DRAFT_618374 [Mycena polygramma]|nr:hypothetical protein DFH06DRAFT_618374 [Mycena polygramma]
MGVARRGERRGTRDRIRIRIRIRIARRGRGSWVTAMEREGETSASGYIIHIQILALTLRLALSPLRFFLRAPAPRSPSLEAGRQGCVLLLLLVPHPLSGPARCPRSPSPSLLDAPARRPRPRPRPRSLLSRFPAPLPVSVPHYVPCPVHALLCTRHAKRTVADTQNVKRRDADSGQGAGAIRAPSGMRRWCAIRAWRGSATARRPQRQQRNA